MRLVHVLVLSLFAGAVSLSLSACSAPPPAPAGACDYATYEGLCQLVALEDPKLSQVPGEVHARYATQGVTASGKRDMLDLRYTVEPRHARMAAQHLADNPVLRCQVAYLRSGSCAPVVTRLKLPDLAGRPAVGAVQLAPQ
ncbi:MAG: hypothetical protein R3B70_02885 [Polyangiaceae bacterium]